MKQLSDAVPLYGPLRLVHALTGILLVAGLLGRWVALADVSGRPTTIRSAP